MHLCRHILIGETIVSFPPEASLEVPTGGASLILGVPLVKFRSCLEPAAPYVVLHSSRGTLPPPLQTGLTFSQGVGPYYLWHAVHNWIPGIEALSCTHRVSIGDLTQAEEVVNTSLDFHARRWANLRARSAAIFLRPGASDVRT